MSKQIKDMLVADLQKRIGGQTEMLVIDSSRLDAITENQMRLALREKDIRVLMVKNATARRALHAEGVEALDPVLAGPSSLVWGGEDIVSLSKELTEWAKKLPDKIAIKGGTVEGTTLLADDVDSLSKSPSREELIGQIAGRLLAVGGNLVSALLGPGGIVAGQLVAISEGEESDTGEAEVTEETSGEDAAAGEEEAGEEEAGEEEAGEEEAGEEEAGEEEAGEEEAGEEEAGEEEAGEEDKESDA